MSWSCYISLMPATEVVAVDHGVTLRSPAGSFSLGALTTAQLDAVSMLTGKGVTIDEWDLFTQGQQEQLAGLALLGRLAQWGVLQTRWLDDDGVEVATLQPDLNVLRGSPQEVIQGSEYVVSRFAYQRRIGADWVVESPFTGSRVQLASSGARDLLHTLAAPTAVVDLTKADRELLGLLVEAGVVVPADAEIDPAQKQWEFHDALFHARSRPGRYSAVYGASYRFRDELPSAPVSQPVDDNQIPLVKGDPLTMPLGEVMQRRKSERHPGSTLTAAELGQFLWHSCRTYNVRPADHDEVSARPYPSGGARHELEIYPVITNVSGIDPGVYRYNGVQHSLSLISEPNPASNAMIRLAARVAASAPTPQVLLTIATRFSRLAWKYESIAYSITLKNVGVLYSTFYNVATAMGLSGCALGAGNTEQFAAATGIGKFTETSVGEFILGGGPAADWTVSDGPGG